MVASTSLALDHLTVADTTPTQLIGIAEQIGCRAICLFMEPMAVLPRMPSFDLYTDATQRRETRRRLDDSGIALDIAYPFTLTGRTDVADFACALDCAADLGASAVNVLAYDRDPARRLAGFGAFCDMARARGLGVVIEFYPLSQIRSLGEAVRLVQDIGRPGEVGINVDLLHLMRSGGSIDDLANAPADYLLYAQQCDGPRACAADGLAFEASSQRLLPGAGVFDLAGFAAAIPAGCAVSVELPQDEALAAGIDARERARLAIDGVRVAIGL